MTAAVAVRATAGSTDPLQPLLVKTVTYKIAQSQTASLTAMPTLVPAPPQQPVRAEAAANPPPAAPQIEVPRIVVASAEQAPALPAVMAKSQPAKAEPAQTDLVMTAPAYADPEPARAEAPSQMHPRSGGWVIQIGAYPAEDEAKQHLTAAQARMHDRLSAADPFTERVLKGDKAYYRARFAGFDKATAEATCKQLKRNDFDCITVRD